MWGLESERRTGTFSSVGSEDNGGYLSGWLDGKSTGSVRTGTPSRAFWREENTWSKITNILQSEVRKLKVTYGTKIYHCELGLNDSWAILDKAKILWWVGLQITLQSGISSPSSNLHSASRNRENSRTRWEDIPGLSLVQSHSTSDTLIGYRKCEGLRNKLTSFPVAAAFLLSPLA